ncbi:MAG: transcription-repair coupling factor [Patescibacteria group bacterium]
MTEKTAVREAHQRFLADSIKALEAKKNLPLSGLPNLACQTFYLAANPYLQNKVFFWLLKKENILLAQRLLIYWHTIFKIAKPVWLLEEVNPIRAIRLKDSKPQIVLVDIANLQNKLPSLNNGESYKLEIDKKELWSPALISKKLISFGYEFTGQASQTGYFSRRGGIVDIYPVNTEKPVRLEFEDNKIINISYFNPINKRLENKLERTEIVAKSFFKMLSRTTLAKYFEAAGDPIIMYQDVEEIKNINPLWLELEESISGFKKIIVLNFSRTSYNLFFESAPLYHQNYSSLAKDIKKWHDNNFQISIATDKTKDIKELLKQNKIASLPVEFQPFSRELDGFINNKLGLAFITDKEIFGEENLRHESPRNKIDQAFIMGMKPGDYVVHLDHGIGRFTGMRRDMIEGIAKEYFSIQYAEGDKLSVPVETADKLSKYIGIAHPKLHRLSGTQWYQLTRKVKQEAKVLAHELLKIYAKREMTKISAFGHETPEDLELAKSFIYKETPDQAKAINEVKNDLEKETPMDRLICGDVGFGKTEVAVRAALKAAMNNTQVALLSPTTILTQQHFDTFSERLKKFPVKIGILSRFETDKQQKDTIEKMKAGLVDIVIGTHRLLSPDVKTKNLGLIIIDEEQRFGVKAKERLKSLRTQAHVLTLTATPIPRTLNIALSGVRDVSIIETPPEGRLPIETHIDPYSEETISEVLSREFKRGGQAYYLHNKVETIAFAAAKLKKLLPQAKIGIAHGRLPEKELAKAMQDFDNQKTNLLVCSTIIENGLDLPNVNTLVVDNATNFGLAQLYQLRGRIGRGERQAYSYFLYHRKKLKGNAQKRLQALMEAKKLGSGFQLALRDLEIRGAGNILGKEQHGKVSAIGLSLYTRLLAQAIEELKFGKIQEPIRDVIIDLPLDAYIPQEFLPEEERLILYQKMAGIVKLDELTELKDKIIRSRTREEQKYIPQELMNLFAILEIKILTQKTDISHIDTTITSDQFGHRVKKVIFKFLFPLKPEKLAILLRKDQNWQFTDDSLKIDLEKLGDHWVEEIKKVLRIFENK